ncbi:MAG: P-loop NTPase fold protein [Acidobacteriota bacterium]
MRSFAVMAHHCPTNFIADDAHGDDAFGGHRTIAESLAHSIRARDASMSIALVGRFGIGKSLIVRLLAKLLERDPYSTVIVFNVWVHRGDVLRRVFMKVLLETLAAKNWISPAARTNAEQAMTRGPNVFRALSRPAAASVAALWAVMAFAVIVFNAFHAIQFPLDVLGRFLFTGGEAAILFVVFTVLAAVALWRLNPDLPIAAAFAPQGWSRTMAETWTAPDLTSIEFQESFKIAVTAALAEKPKKRLVIALDDIDRLERDDARNVVDALRIFLDLRDHADVGALMQQVWFITPFNPQKPEVLPGDLRERLFDRQTVVPPPVLPMVSGYFQRQFRVVLEKHTDVEAIELYSMVAEAWKSDPDAITPRRINRFLNGIATLHEEWRCAIPLKSIVHFVLKGLDKPFSYNDVSTAEAIAGLPGWPTHLAALFFHIQPQRVAAVQHEPRMRLAIETGDAEVLHAVSEIEHFAETSEQIVRSMETNLEQSPEMLMHAAKAFALLTDPPYERVWQKLIAAAVKRQTWPVAESSLSGLRMLLLRCDAEQRRAIEKVLLQNISAGVQLGRVSEIPALETWFANADAFAKDHLVPIHEIIAGSARFRTEVLHAIFEGRFHWPVDPQIVVGDELLEAIVEICRGADPLVYLPTIRRLIELCRNSDWTSAIEKMTETLNMASALTPAHPSAAAILQVFLLLEEITKNAAATERLDWYISRFVSVLIAAGIDKSLVAPATAIAIAVTRGAHVEEKPEGGMFSVNAKNFRRAIDFVREPHSEPDLVRAGSELLRTLGIDRPLQPSESWRRLAVAVEEAKHNEPPLGGS